MLRILDMGFGCCWISECCKPVRYNYGKKLFTMLMMMMVLFA